MKTIQCIILATLLCGCASFDNERFAQGFASGMNARTTQRQQPAYEPVKRTDQQCLSTCLQGGYQYGLCQSKCTY